MTYEFDEEINRFGTHCVKWEYEFVDETPVESDRAHPRHGEDRLLPLWVADMDFRSPPQVINALEERAAHGIFGYSVPADCYYEAVQDWMARRYGRHIERDWIIVTPGVVAALYTMVQAFTEPGDKVIIQTPVYHPFYSAVEENGRILVGNPLKLDGDRYEMDFEDLAQKAADPQVKMIIICSPHNPVGRVWTAEELARLGEICLQNDVLVVSDEIHSDLILSGQTFTGFDSISEELAQKSVICTAASKTFNLAGLKVSNIFVRSEGLREAFKRRLAGNGIWGAGAFGIVATEAAYRYGEPWLADVMAYIEENYRYLQSFLAQHMPQLWAVPMQGTYLAWINFAALGISPAERKTLLMEEARVWLNEGSTFGSDGADFERVNLACSRALLAQALERIHTAVSPYLPQPRS
jgi:cysteine-S-conjugate beta-lyase